MQSIISKGKTITEAVDMGLTLLETTKSQVNIEIMQQETKGILGIGGKEAVVKLTKTIGQNISHKEVTKPSEKSLEQALEQSVNEVEAMNSPHSIAVNEKASHVKREEEDLAGKVWVKDGRISCKDLSTHYPSISIGTGIKLYRNNELVNEKVIVVSEQDQLEVELENEEKETDWKVSLDEQKLHALLQTKPGYKITRTLKNIEPNQHIKLEIVETRETMNTVAYGDVIERLSALHVVHGFNQDEILKAINTSEEGTYTIASGKSPKPGKDGWIELKVNVDEKKGTKVNENGFVDFRETRSIPVAERGQVIAIVHPPIPGETGVTVTNEPLPAKQTYPLSINADKTLTVVDDKIVCLESGRPNIEQRGSLVKISIMPKLTHRGNLDLASGNIHFKGDVEVLGEVEENMTVEAEGRIFIQDIVNRGTLTASGSISTNRNVVASEVSAGKSNMLVTELGHLLGVMHQSLEKMISVINQLNTSPAFKSTDEPKSGLQPLIKILLDKKFKSFPPLAKKYVEVSRKGKNHLGDEWREIAVSLSQLFLSLTNEIVSLDRIEDLSMKMKELYEESVIPVEPDSYVSIPTVTNSIIYCSGDVRVTEQGSINSKIHAGGEVFIKGILRGGEIYGRLGVNISEVGADSGTSTLISVPHDQTIRINHVKEGTTVKIGNHKHTFKEDQSYVYARIDQEDRMVFY